MSAEKEFTIEEARKIGRDLGVDWSKVNVEEFRIGLGIEMEHGSHDPQTDVTGNDPMLTGKIAMAHINEFPNYYSRLLNAFGSITNKEVVIIAKIKILPGFEAEVMNAAKIIWVETNKEQGCLAFRFNTVEGRNDTIVFFEVFKSQDDFKNHRLADYTVKFLEGLKGKIVNDEPTLMFLEEKVII